MLEESKRVAVITDSGGKGLVAAKDRITEIAGLSLDCQIAVLYAKTLTNSFNSDLFSGTLQAIPLTQIRQPGLGADFIDSGAGHDYLGGQFASQLAWPMRFDQISDNIGLISKTYCCHGRVNQISTGRDMTTTSAKAPDEVATKSIAACAHFKMAIGQFAYKNQASNNTNWSMAA